MLKIFLKILLYFAQRFVMIYIRYLCSCPKSFTQDALRAERITYMNEKEKDMGQNAPEEENNKPKKKRSAYSYLTGKKRAVPIILIGLSVFFALCFITKNTGYFGEAVSSVFLGLFAVGGYFIPFLLLLHAIFYPVDTLRKRTASRIVFSVIALLTLSTVAHCITYINTEYTFSVSEFYTLGTQVKGGGFFGGVLAFALIKAFGKIGLFIIAAVIFALYITYFFSSGRNLLSKVLLKTLNFLSDLFTGIGRKSKMRKTEKKAKLDTKKRERLAAAQEGLTSDEFFAVDNGMSEMHIKELGISEVRDEAELERNPDLKTKVFHKSAISEEEYQKSQSKTSDEYTFFGNKGKKKRTFVGKELYDSVGDGDFEPRADDIIYGEAQQKSMKSERAMYGLDENADDVFNASFEAFDFKVNQEIASRPSSKASTVAREPDEVYEYTDPVAYERREQARLAKEKLAKERAEFERRKAAAVEARKRMEEKQNTVAEILGKEVAPPPKSAYSKEPVSMSFEANGKEYREEAPKYEGDYLEEVSFEFGPKREAPKKEAPAYTAPSYGQSLHASAYEEPKYTPTHEEPKYTPTYEEPKYTPNYEETESKPAYTTSYGSEASFSGIQEKGEESITVSRTMLGGNTESEPVYSEENADIPTVQFEFEAEELETAEEEEPAQVFEFDSDEELDGEDEENYLDAEPEDIPDDDGEIPPEEQNPEVIKMRSMFPFLSDTPADKRPENKHLYEYADEDEREEEEKTATEIKKPPFDIPARAVPAPPPTPAPQSKEEKKPEEPIRNTPDYSDYKYPPIDLLKEGTADDDESFAEEMQQNADKLIDALVQFEIKASIKGIDHGPRITRYEIVPARGVRVSRITGLFDDIALAMAAEGIRMEAPIPGKSAIGVEIPNKHPSLVLLRDLVETDEFISAKKKTTACIGKDVTGNPVFCDISKMPHLLIAGATGMGKSVCINSILVSILYKARPDEVKFIMIDPKKVEFNGYNGIPHLLVPVVTDVKQAAGALMWACEQMEKRYDLMEKFEVRNLDAYNDKVKEDPTLGEPLPKIIIVIDELNDIMLQVRKPAEDLIMSIAQKARAAGIHLIIGTQRPSVDVITGVIKANIPSRISCKVTSGTDSKTILDTVGAEKLLKNGDMLYNPAGAPKPLRVQGAFVSDGEVSSIMKFLKSQVKGNVYDEQALEEINNAAKKCSKGKGDDEFDSDEELEENAGILNDQQFLDAVDLAIRQKKISTSLIQRKLSIGYGKAAKFIDFMEDLGIVSEPNGQKPRDVLITSDDWHEMLARRSLD